ncbi:glycine cleavage system aminomethyltransferase GcvT [Rhodobacterales bacterium HKCCE2091]|nr:glycine cleavage system aminomethyltransferase GcvT [Rhodobacterales bacterium HKCCE2091]
MDALRRLPLHDLHAALGAKFGPFAGWSMPVQYPAGVMAEHLWCREKAALFDVSHMGQVLLPSGADAALETLVPADILGLAEGRQRYGLFTDDAGGVLDDLMIARRKDGLFLVVNAACAGQDIAHLKAHIETVVPVDDRALLALQGPMAGDVLAAIVPSSRAMTFMDVAVIPWKGVSLWLSRSGYTGEDGFEISVPVMAAEALANAILSDDRAAPAGLGARDSLRLEAGLPLYGQDMSPDISPVEAGQKWAIPKVRRRGGEREGGFPGAEMILSQIDSGAPRKRIGLLPEGRAPMRAGVELFDAEDGGTQVGIVTSGGFGPSLGAPMAIALVDADLPDDAMIWGEVRGRRLPARQAKTPFVTPGYKR